MGIPTSKTGGNGAPAVTVRDASAGEAGGPMRGVMSAIREGSRFLVASHVNPDGDAVGAMAAMGHLLGMMGKEAVLYNVSGLPSHFSWLALPSPIRTELPRSGFDWIVALDCGDERRGGEELRAAMAIHPTMVVDHHVANPEWGGRNWVEANRSSTCEMVGVLAEALGVELAGPLGEALYLGIVTDTGNFSFDNTSPECMEMAARIVRLGLEPGRVNERIQHQWSKARFALWGEALAGLRPHFDGRLGAIHVTHEQFARLGATGADCEGLTNFVLRLKGCQVAQLLREDTPGTLKLSLRSISGVNIQPVAAAFGGGGHKGAAGATIKGTIADVEPRVVAALENALKARETCSK